MVRVGQHWAISMFGFHFMEEEAHQIPPVSGVDERKAGRPVHLLCRAAAQASHHKGTTPGRQDITGGRMLIAFMDNCIYADGDGNAGLLLFINAVSGLDHTDTTPFKCTPGKRRGKAGLGMWDIKMIRAE